MIALSFTWKVVVFYLLLVWILLLELSSKIGFESLSKIWLFFYVLSSFLVLKYTGFCNVSLKWKKYFSSLFLVSDLKLFILCSSLLPEVSNFCLWFILIISYTFIYVNSLSLNSAFFFFVYLSCNTIGHGDIFFSLPIKNSIVFLNICIL